METIAMAFRENWYWTKIILYTIQAKTGKQSKWYRFNRFQCFGVNEHRMISTLCFFHIYAWHFRLYIRYEWTCCDIHKFIQIYHIIFCNIERFMFRLCLSHIFTSTQTPRWSGCFFFFFRRTTLTFLQIIMSM